MLNKITYPIGKAPRAAVYLRIPPESETEGRYEGLAGQNIKARVFCTANGYELKETHVYTDRAPGSAAPEERPALSKLLEAARRGEFDVLVVHKIDRLARNLKIFLDVEKELETSKICLKSITEPVDTDTPSGRVMLTMLGVMTQFETEFSKGRGSKWYCPSCESWQ